MSEEIRLEVIQNTQKILGKYVKKPVLSEKLLRKPPFRFLHDIVTAVIRETGFLKGLYTEAEMKSENIKEREAKTAFLNKLINAINTIANVKLKVKASKIVAGLEPTETNQLLQEIGKALDKKLDSSPYIEQFHDPKVTKKLKEKSEVKKTSTDRTKRTTSKQSDLSSDRKSNDSLKQKVRTPRVSETEKDKKPKAKSKRGSSLESPSSRTSLNDLKKKPKEKRSQINSDLQESPHANEKSQIEDDIKEVSEVVNEEKIAQREIDVAENLEPEESIAKPLERPKSAKPRSAVKRVQEKIEDKEEEPQIPVPVQRPMSSLRPPSVRPSSARPGAPRLRPDSTLPPKEMVPLGKINVIVENFGNKDEDEEETVVVQTETEPDLLDKPDKLELNLPQQKGHLVEQILEEINETENVEVFDGNIVVFAEDETKRKDSASREINQLRDLIQTLTRTANPLGKILNYIHEDVEAMYNELNMWISTKKQTNMEIEKQKRICSELSKPLQTKLEELEKNIAKQEEEIQNMKAKILKNDQKIKQLAVNK